jgi:hypothetical protein
MKNKIINFFPLLILFSSIVGTLFIIDYLINKDNLDEEKNNNHNALKLEEGEKLEEDINLPDAINLEVSFICQAPNSDWNPPFDHACEEATVLMMHYYYQKKNDISNASEEIRQIVDFEKEKYNNYEDSSSEETAQLIKDYFNYNAEVVYNISFEDIKEKISRGHPVIIPTAGRLLENPYFTPPGPFYHMLLVKGYNKEGLIVHDPGTIRGADWLYPYSILEIAIHDWDGEGDIREKPSAMIVINNYDF